MLVTKYGGMSGLVSARRAKDDTAQIDEVFLLHSPADDNA